MQDRPTAVELLRAAQEFCEKDLAANLTGRVRFHARVLQNVLQIIERELLHEEDAVRAEWERLRALLDEDAQRPETFGGHLDQVKAWNEELSRKIRDGELDGRFEETRDALYEIVLEKVAIANPKWVGE